MSSYPNENEISKQKRDTFADETNWVDSATAEVTPPPHPSSKVAQTESQRNLPIAMVETAFLASTGSLIWLINYYFPMGPLLKMFFPVPIALIFLRRGSRAAWMTTLVSGLLLGVLLGPPRSIFFLIPYGLMGLQLGLLWRRGASWYWSIFIGTLIGTFGFFFRFWLMSILLGEDLWLYVLTQITELADWLFLHLGILAQPDIWFIQVLALISIVVNNLVYLFVVHIVSLIMLDRLGSPIPRPPHWVQVLFDYE